MNLNGAGVVEKDVAAGGDFEIPSGWSVPPLRVALVVAGDGGRRESLCDALEADMFLTIGAADGGEAETVCARVVPDLTIIDPDDDAESVALIEKLRSMPGIARMPFIVSATAPSALEESFGCAAGCLFVRKQAGSGDIPEIARGLFSRV